MRILSPDQLAEQASSTPLLPLLENVVIFPDGSATWVIPAADEVIPVAHCEVVSADPMPIELLRLPHPHQPEIWITVPEFTPIAR
jgi:hypothetical protein